MSDKTESNAQSGPEPANSRAGEAFKQLGEYGISTFAATVIEMALRIIKNAVFTRILGPSGRGFYGLFLTIPQLSVSFGNMGYGLGSVYLVSRKKADLRGIYGNSLVSALVQGAVLVGIGLALARSGLVSGWSPEAAEQVGAFVLIAIPLMFMVNYSQDILMAIKDIHRMNALLIAFSALPIAFLFAFWFTTRNSLLSALLAWTVSAVLVAGSGFAFIQRRAGGGPLLSWSSMKQAYAYGLRGNISMFANSIVRRVDMLFIAAFMDMEHVGYYAAAVSIAELLLALPSAISVPFLPIRLELDKRSGKDFTPIVAKYVLLLMIPACVVTGLLGKWIIVVLFGADFLPALVPLLWLLPGMLALSLYQFAKADAYSLDHPGAVSVVSLITMISNLILNYILIPAMGTAGAALASTVSYVLSTALLTAFVIRRGGHKPGDVLMLRKADFKLLGDGIRSLLERRRGR